MPKGKFRHITKSIVGPFDRPLNVLDVYKLSSAFAGAGDLTYGFDRRNYYHDTSRWKAGYNGSVWTVSDTSFSGSVGTTSDPIWSLETDPGLESFIITVKAKPPFYFRFKVEADLSAWFEYYVDGTNVSLRRVTNSGGTITTLDVMPYAVSNSRSWKIYVNEYKDYSIDYGWLNIAIFDGTAFVSHYQIRQIDSEYGDGIGFLLGANGTISWEEDFHPRLAYPIDWYTIDPGGTSLQAARNAVGERGIILIARPNGTVKIIRPEEEGSKYTFSNEDIYNVSFVENLREVVTRVKFWGAYHLSERVNNDALEKYGDQFAEVNNPISLTQSATDAAAEDFLDLSQSMGQTISFSSRWIPFLEVGDVATVGEYGVFAITSIDLSITNVSVVARYNGRRLNG